MVARIIDGREIAKKIKESIKKRASTLSFTPGLATILVGDNKASKLYVNMKHKACSEIGFNSKNIELPAHTTEEELISLINQLNNDKGIHGILVQLPLPEQINTENVMGCINPDKDVDGLHPINLGFLLVGEESFAPATPKGIIRLLDECDVELKGSEVVIINHSTVVGKPLSLMLLNRDATVTICHVHSKDLKKHTLNADVIVSATGIPGLIKGDMVKTGVVIIDAGITSKGKKVVGDVDESVNTKACCLTPVPGGVGPMTIAMLLENTLHAAEKSSF